LTEIIFNLVKSILSIAPLNASLVFGDIKPMTVKKTLTLVDLLKTKKGWELNICLKVETPSQNFLKNKVEKES